jgi:hypothetical protein
VKWLLSMAVAIYLVGAIGFGLERHATHDEDTLIDSVQYGLLWPGVLVQMAQSPEL